MQHITDLWQHIQHLVITQYRDSTNLLSLLRKVFSSFQDLEDSAFRLSNFANIDEAEGEWLDLIGKFRNIPRQPGETDEMYKARLKISFKKNSAGTPNNIIENARDLSSDPSPHFLDECPAIFFVYTPRGRQLRRRVLQMLAPAGVLALPAAGLKLAGSNRFLATVQHPQKKIVTVALEESVIENNYLSTETGQRIMTEDGKCIVL